MKATVNMSSVAGIEEAIELKTQLKQEFCYKYYLAKKFPEEHFILRDLSVSTETVYDEFDNNLGTHICCNKDNRYKCFRWED